MPTLLSRLFHRLAPLTALSCCSALAAAAPATKQVGVFARVSLTTPADRPWRVHIVAQASGAKPRSLFVGKTIAETAKAVDWLAAAESGGWVDLSEMRPTTDATVRFLFETQPAPDQAGEQTGIVARIDIATAPDDASVLRCVTEHDTGNVIAIRIPADPTRNKDRILSIREDTQRRLDDVKAFAGLDAPRPQKIWCMTGFRSNGEFYTDPAIARMDFEIVRRLGMNGYWQQNGGQPGDLRRMSHENGLDRSTVYWRSVQSLPPDKALGGSTRLDWEALDHFLDKIYRDSIAGTRKQHPDGLPELIADLMDEPDGLRFDGPEYVEAFRGYLRQQRLGPEFFGRKTWGEVSPVILRWRAFFTKRAELVPDDEPARRLFYWSIRFWNYSTARAYALATSKVEKYAPGVATRVNFGPPWVYDYGTLPRGIDAFEFGRLRAVTMGFNEDWVGRGSARVPLEINTLLMDWSRAAARPSTPLLGAYITRDANRTSVKLRTFACLAREAKVFDFYYYGPAYTFFDPWSDNASMVRGVAELTRDMGAVDALLWQGRAPKAEVALLYSHSWPVWKTDDTEQVEQMMAYVALLHAGVPVDIVSDAEVADGRFAARRYKALYVVNESVPALAAAEIERWVRGGGHLWASGWAAIRDEYNTPTDGWNEMLGVKARSWKPAGDLKRLGETLQPADWTRPVFGREVRFDPADTIDAKPAEPVGHRSDAYRRTHGKGLVQLAPGTAGKAYMDGATTKEGTLAHAVLFPADERRKVFADFALESGASPPAATSVSQILAWPLWTQGKGVVLLANFTGEPAADLHVQFVSPFTPTKARSLHHGERPLTRLDSQHFEVTVPINEVTDIIVVE